MNPPAERLLPGEPHPPAQPIRLGQDNAQAAGRAVRWQWMLVWFMRVTAVLWLLEGFAHWHAILVSTPSELETATGWRAAALVGFAVTDLLTAVGLWLVTPWGGVLWVLNVALQMAAIVLLPGFFPGARALLAIYAALVLLYLFLTYRAGREEMAQEG